MAAVRILLGVVWLAVVGSAGMPERDFIGNGFTYQNKDYGRICYPDKRRAKIVAIAKKEVGVRETMENSGTRVDEYNAYVGLHKVAWCSSFVSWCYGRAGYPQPRTAWSPDLFPKNRLAKDPLAGMVLGIYFKELKRVGHCGIVEWTRGSWIGSIEGNTNLNGGREGTGVYARTRHFRTIRCYADWIGKGGVQ